jgi:hypothetical protein
MRIAILSAYRMRSTQKQNIFSFSPFDTARNNIEIITPSRCLRVS